MAHLVIPSLAQLVPDLKDVCTVAEKKVFNPIMRRTPLILLERDAAAATSLEDLFNAVQEPSRGPSRRDNDPRA